MAPPKVYAISAGVPFLPTLADALLGGRFGGSFHGGDPLALADATILLPTRRSARALRQIFVERAAGRAAILPRIRTIGDVDEEEHLLDASGEQTAEAFMLPPTISRLERTLTLAELVLAWGRVARGARIAADPSPLLIPATAGDAMRLATDLARLIDEMATAGVDWSAFDSLVPDEYPGYWQLTLDFLKIAGERWPEILAERAAADPAARRDTLLRAEAERLTRSASAGPIIAAGSTGSIPATAFLLKTIAGLADGAVVLPGLDTGLDDKAWAAIGDPADPGAGAPSHPQSGLKQLLARIGIDRRDVEPLAVPPPRMAARSALMSETMRPAETTDAWATTPREDHGAALHGLDVLVARNETEEALAIAIALRESVEVQGRVAALVTPDRTLARRVAVELGRWGIRVDDSAGQPLAATQPGGFAVLLAEAAMTADPVKLMALAKHPLAAFQLTHAECRRAARALELAILRGPGRRGTLAELPAQLANVRLEIEMKANPLAPRARRRLTKLDWTLAEKLAARFAEVLGPLAALRDGREVAVAEATAILARALDAAADDRRDGKAALWSGPAGNALAKLLSGLLGPQGLRIAPADFPGFLGAAMAPVSVTPPVGSDPRIHIWGTLEARLQSVDLVILGALDEGVWPPEIRSDPWLSRRMRSALGLPPPERRIGLAAHDFALAFGQPRVILSRAEKRGGAPTVPSRWLQRLAAVIGPEIMDGLVAKGRRLVALARAIDRVPPSAVTPVVRPQPRPPVAARPRELSVTSIENLIRDPYAVYARRILQLEPLDPIGQRADPRLRGSLIHAALSDFTKEWHAPFDQAARARLLAIWREHFREIEAYPEVHAVWWLLADRIADWIVGWEAGRAADMAARLAEIKGELAFEAPGGPFRLTARADRIDVFKDGRVGIYDYKTGAPPSAKQVLLFQPQLALEVAMARAGGFGQDFADRSVAELAWIGLARIGKDDPRRDAVDEGWTADGIGEEAMRRLRRLIAAYDDPSQGYASQARPMFERRFPGDYDHLARVSEWRQAAGGAE